MSDLFLSSFSSRSVAQALSTERTERWLANLPTPHGAVPPPPEDVYRRPEWTGYSRRQRRALGLPAAPRRRRDPADIDRVEEPS